MRERIPYGVLGSMRPKDEIAHPDPLTARERPVGVSRAPAAVQHEHNPNEENERSLQQE
jgi:hypothetical protein